MVYSSSSLKYIHIKKYYSLKSYLFTIYSMKYINTIIFVEVGMFRVVLMSVEKQRSSESQLGFSGIHDWHQPLPSRFQQLLHEIPQSNAFLLLFVLCKKLSLAQRVEKKLKKLNFQLCYKFYVTMTSIEGQCCYTGFKRITKK